MRILVIGSGGREHALCWKLAQSPGVELYASPGNPGMSQVATCLTPEQAEAMEPDLTVIGPEAPLVFGVADRYRERGLAVVGPSAEAARLEGSKDFAKTFMVQAGIPTARFVTAATPADALGVLDGFSFPVVLKMDGLAAGKGVAIVHDRAEAEQALAAFHGRIVVEEFLSGTEVSFIAVCDGRDAVPLEPTQDHKAVFDGDKGPNTGGMGAYCDSAILTAAQSSEILQRVILPTVEATGFSGFLYAGLMMTADGPKVLEFNVRLGDPETQPLMRRLQSDLVPVLMASARGELRGVTLNWRAEPSVCVVMASGGYPGSFDTGKLIRGIPEAESLGTKVFQAGTRMGPHGLETAGGRVLGVTGSGKDLSAAAAHAYQGVEVIHFDSVHFRTDIARRVR